MIYTICFLLSFLSFSLLNSLESKPAVIQLKNIEGKTWLVDSRGNPFFAHGISHCAHGHNQPPEVLDHALKQLGFNSYGYGCPESLKELSPYCQGTNDLVPISIYRAKGNSFQYLDIFDPKQQAIIEYKIKQMCLKNRNNPNLIGYYWTDLAAWPLKNKSGTNWVEYIRTLDDHTPGKKAYNKFLRTWKGNDDNIRDLTFLKEIAKIYFKVCGTANRKYDPHHLILGERFLIQTFVPEVVEEMLPYVDAIAIQPYFLRWYPKNDFDRIHRLSGKPLILCDFAVSFKEKDKKVFGGMLAENEKESAKYYTDYIKKAFNSPYIIGSFFCNPITSFEKFYPPGYVKQGLFDIGFKPRQHLNNAMLDLNEYIKNNTPQDYHP